MIRKSLFSALLVLVMTLSTAIHAGGLEYQSISPFSHGYLGGGLGARYLFGNVTGLENTAAAAPTLSELSRTQLGKGGFTGNVHLGYGHSFSKFYFAGELFGEWYANSATDFSFDIAEPTPLQTSIEISTVEVKNAYGLLIRPGLQPTPESIFYLNLGVGFAKIKLTENLLIFPTGGGAIVVGTTQTARHSSKAGFRVGFGTAIALSKHVAVRMDYFYTGYGHLITNIFSPTNNPLSQNKATNIRAHIVLLNFDFLF